MNVTAGIVSEVIIHNTEGTSDKLYRVELIDEGGTFAVRAANCRRGDAWKDQGFKLQGATREAAEKKAASIIKAKRADGYGDYLLGGGSGSGFVANPQGATNEDTGVRLQLLNEVDEAEVERLLNDDAWGLQEKKDGRRRGLGRKGEAMTGINKKGQATPVEQWLADATAKVDGDFLVDGELVGDTHFVFDLLEWKGNDLRHLGFEQRFATLVHFMGNADSKMKLVPLVIGTAAKRLAYEKLKAENAEGVVFKRLKAKFGAGRPASGGDQLKFKFYATASFEVTASNQQRSVVLGLRSVGPDHHRAADMPKGWLGLGMSLPMGNVTIPPNAEKPVVGDVVEVRYLYCHHGGKVFQGVYLGKRDDVDAAECTIAQLKFKPEQAGGDDEDEG